jgi:formylglycine-generating enzyme required for sulfatase activity/dienelactone hydrolase/predicted Ser/Thr protein kinase
MPIGPERWREVEAIYHAALERPEGDRAKFLREACRGDQELLGEVESLLRYDSKGANLPERPGAMSAGAGPALSPGRRLGAYEIVDLLGAGGMGEVYRARDTRLDRTVALKVLPADLIRSPERRERFEREARAVSRLSHPHICTLYDIGREGDTDFLVMEYLEGEPLAKRLQRGPLPPEEALSHAVQMAQALGAAHQRGVIHRDLKPANVVLTGSGAKLLDFGLAKLTMGSDAPAAETAETMTKREVTRTGVAVGTPAYMSPEQAQGGAVDARTDVFSLGATLFEMLAGRRPFQGDSTAAVLASLLRDDAPRIDALRPGVPKDLADIVARCLARDRELRYRSGVELLDALVACQARLAAPPARMTAGRRRVVVAAVLAVALVGLVLGKKGLRLWREREAQRETVPEIQRLVQADDTYHAFVLARRVAPLLAGDPTFDHLWDTISVVADIKTDPPGAEVAIKPYMEPDAPWETLGVSPVASVRLPYAYLRWRITRPGYRMVEGAYLSEMVPRFVLTPVESGPADMVRVGGGPFRYNNVRPVVLTDFWLDRYEVTNRQFKTFVDQGGYRTKAFWMVPFVEGGRTLSWDEAMARFQDATGRPGPAEWELGAYPDGQDEYPVSGVSWYEAAAYAEFAGKSLPTFFHWYRAAELGIISDILLLSNFGEKGPAPVGQYQGLGPWGTYDQAGNVREWCWNATAAGEHRFTLGGAWDDPTYLYSGPEAVSPWDRSARSGFRCARYPDPPAADTLAPVGLGTTRDYDRETPVSDEVFAAYRSLYAYDRTPLDARVERTDDSAPHWRHETVTFAAAYGGERVIAQLYLPREKPPPYEVVVYSPPGSALVLRSSEHVGFPDFTFLVRSGRAVLLPVYKGTYERRVPLGGPNVYRDLMIQQFKDLGRSLDWVETRPDLRADRVGYYGLSMGASMGIINAALEPRLRAIVLVSGGLFTGPAPGEIDPFNFAPRITAPVLLIAGRDDFRRPLKASQEPLMRLLGSREKRHYVFEGGHVPPRWQDVIKETLDWFDKYLGPV